MNVIRTKTPLPIPGLRAARRRYFEWLAKHAEADAIAHDRQAAIARKEAQRLRVLVADHTN